MENQLTLSYASDEVSDLIINNTDLAIRSWNMFAVLLSLGHPVPPIELASRVGAASSEFVEFACSVPKSPISLTSDGLVTVSYHVCTVIQRFLLRSNRVLKVLVPGEITTSDYEIDVMYFRKRRRLCRNVSVRADRADFTPFRSRNACEKFYNHADDMVRRVIMNKENCSFSKYNDGRSDEMTFRMPSLVKYDTRHLEYRSNVSKHETDREMGTSLSKKKLGSKNTFIGDGIILCLPSLSTTTLGGVKDHFQFRSSSHPNATTSVRIEDIKDDSCLMSEKPSISYCQADENQKRISLVKAMIINRSSGANNKLLKGQGHVEGSENKCNLDSVGQKDDVENSSDNTVNEVLIHGFDIENMNNLNCNDMTPYSGTEMEAPIQQIDKQNVLFSTEPENLCINDTQMDDLQKNMFSEFTANLEAVPKDANSTVQKFSITTNKGHDVGSQFDQKYCRKDRRSALMKQRLKPTSEQKMETTERLDNTKENMEKTPVVSVKGLSEQRVVPEFDSYITEEAEGSGGYGTVYKVRRKTDGTTFAVKYPHANANRHHVYNELKMLERFGGKNFVIKYEGSFKSGNSHCLVLEHVAHDRPEVLKRDIDEYQLRWYGYCLFKALASLHKQGVVHRDVKPGNFLFSSKTSKGYLIDFNLATDLHQKIRSTEISLSQNDGTFGFVSSSQRESFHPSKTRKYASSKGLEAGTNTKSHLLPKNLKKKTDQVKEQGADGSGITSTKDATSNRHPSAERFRQPIPSTGRKELLNLVHQAMQQNHDNEATRTPAIKRKRVAAPPAKLDHNNNNFIYLTPMPLQCTGVTVAGSGFGLFKNKGEGKQRKEGSCVGTKGFRAPEVLLKSTYQGPKVDVWSAGVTLLYLIIGKTPFVGDPEQNIKEITKLRGSEDLWEVAKLHDRESSFPQELLDIQSLTSIKLEEWCKQNTRRPDFVPTSLIDLVDKCLTVNPRLRISAEEALRHEFFTPCLKELAKKRMLRQRLSPQPVTLEGPRSKTSAALS